MFMTQERHTHTDSSTRNRGKVAEKGGNSLAGKKVGTLDAAPKD